MLCYHYAMLLLLVWILVRGVPSLNTSKGTDRAAMHGAFAVDDPPRGQPIMWFSELGCGVWATWPGPLYH